MPDQTCTCIDCKQPFVFTEGEQRFYEERGFTPPKRCKPCRDIKKAQRQDREIAQANSDPAPAPAPVVENRGGRRGDENWGNSWEQNEGRGRERRRRRG